LINANRKLLKRESARSKESYEAEDHLGDLSDEITGLLVSGLSAVAEPAQTSLAMKPLRELMD
jgi:hypothetical protein